MSASNDGERQLRRIFFSGYTGPFLVSPAVYGIGPVSVWVAVLFEQLIRPQQQRGRDRHAEGFGRLEVEDELRLDPLLDRELAAFRTLRMPFI